MIKALIFDFDGLILDTEITMFQTWQEIFQTYGLSLSMQEWAGFLGHSADPEEPYIALEQHLNRPIDREALHSMRVKHEGELLQFQEALPGVEALIHEAKSNGMKLAVASSSDRNWVTKHLSRLDLIAYFDVIKCAEDVMHTKPHPDLYIAALEALEIDADQAIVLEDSINGLKAAKAAGIFCVAVPNKITSQLQTPDADVILNSLKGITLERLIALSTQKQYSLSKDGKR
jgi:HAD superfamily hydrolase (TIGR01509 family)